VAKEKTTSDSKDTGDGKARAAAAASAVRVRIAQVVWLICVLCALVLALGALLVALDANKDNALVQFILETADFVDLGVFDRKDGVMKFTGENAATKNALVNWGLAAVVWLIIGRILDRIIRP
jgi:hypothetical protein